MRLSNRTRDLPPIGGLGGFIRDLRYHEASRQGLALVLILVYTWTARPSAALLALGVPLVVLGTVVRLYASGFIAKNSELATDGPYSLMRHPLYTGNILVVIGFALGNGLWWALPLALVFFWFYYPTAIQYEDRKLHALFGEAWQRWAAAVPALVPAIGNFKGFRLGQWSIRKSFARNGEILVAIYVVVCVAVIVHRAV
ncbi:MAG TPA: isoprenylcysteine carboxylmethyltransferase family protein [Gammaproteobacteria bacterium]|nr:isoprenylcysteine carboxylmethyltransferase family protein [Gammaproteobacteria bacterium]